MPQMPPPNSNASTGYTGLLHKNQNGFWTWMIIHVQNPIYSKVLYLRIWLMHANTHETFKFCIPCGMAALVKCLSGIPNEFISVSPEMVAKRENSFCVLEYAKSSIYLDISVMVFSTTSRRFHGFRPPNQVRYPLIVWARASMSVLTWTINSRIAGLECVGVIMTSLFYPGLLGRRI